MLHLLRIFFLSLLLSSVCQTILWGQHTLSDSPVSYTFSNMPLEKVLRQVSKDYDLRFAYRNSLVTADLLVDQEFRSIPLPEFLEQLLKPFNLCYTYQNKQVIIHDQCQQPTTFLQGTVMNKETSESIAFASVSIAGKSLGSIADHNGQFEFEFESGEVDTLVFTSMGFESAKFSVDQLTINEEIMIWLEPKPVSIDTVYIIKPEYYLKEVGNRKGSPSGSLYIDTHGQQTGLYIANKKGKQGRLMAVQFFLSEKGNVEAPFRIRIYRIDEHGKPSDDILPGPIVVKPTIAEGWYRIDLSELRLQFHEEGFFVAMEGVFPDDYDYYYGSSGFVDLSKPQDNQDEKPSLAYGQRLGYNRKYNEHTWHYSMSHTWFQLEEQKFGVMISAVVKYEKERKQRKDKKRRNKQHRRKNKPPEIETAGINNE